MGLFHSTLANAVRQVFMFEVVDGTSRFSERAAQRRVLMREELQRLRVVEATIVAQSLFEPTANVVGFVEEFVEQSDGDIVLDTTSLPKRFFLPALKLLLQDRRVTTLIVTYTAPESYTSDPLAEDPEPVLQIPLFAGQYPTPDVTGIIIGLGFQPLGLVELLDDAGTATPIHMLLPYSADPDHRRRNWELVRSVQEHLPRANAPTVVSPFDTPEAFDQILKLSGGMQGYAILAPYGPKPISVAMGLLAASREWPIYYTQPKVYNPDYSRGIGVQGGQLNINAYCIKLDGRNLYST